MELITLSATGQIRLPIGHLAEKAIYSIHFAPCQVSLEWFISAANGGGRHLGTRKGASDCRGNTCGLALCCSGHH